MNFDIEVKNMVNHRMSVALHILSLIALTEQKEQLTSDWIAARVNTNPVVIRRLIASLNKAGLVKAVRGLKGLTLTKETDQITLLEVYRAVSPDHELFSIYEEHHTSCQIGRNLKGNLREVYDTLQNKMEHELAQITLSMVVDQSCLER